MALPLIPLLAALALPAAAADVEMESAPEPDTGVDMPEVEVRQPNIDRQVSPERGIRQPDVRLPQVDMSPPRTGLNESTAEQDEATGAEGPTVRGGMRSGERQIRRPDTDTRRPNTGIREPATGVRQPGVENRRPSTSIRAPASE